MGDTLGDYLTRNLSAFVDLDLPPAPPEDPDVVWHRRLHDLSHPFQRNTISMLVSREQALDYGLVEPTEEEQAEREAWLRAWRRPDRRARRWVRARVRAARVRLATAVAGFPVDPDRD